MAAEEPYIPFSIRTGLEPPPPQLQLGEASQELRRLIDYALSLELTRGASSTYGSASFNRHWITVAQDFHVRFLKLKISTFRNDTKHLRSNLEDYVNRASIGELFNLVEFFARHPDCSMPFKSQVASAFVDARAAYRLYDGLVVAIGTEEQAQAFDKAVAAAEASGAGAARTHLVAAGVELREGNWAGSVRESIHAVEAMARKLEPEAKTLGPALTRLEKSGRLHGALKVAFDKLYGYASDKEGIRHALVFEPEATVDEADALFMLGACASFVSYLIARSSEV